MAICPECLEEKSLVSIRCPHCTQEIGYARQFLTQCVYYGTIVLTMTFLVVLLKACTG